MKRLLFRPGFRLTAVILLLLASAFLGSACYFRIWSWRDWIVYLEMSRECHPVWRDLHWGQVYAGQDVDEVIAATKPVRVESYGDFVELNYQQGLSYTGVTITAKQGRLASAWAWSCTWSKPFFDELTEEDHRQFLQAYEAHWAPLREKQ